MAARQSKASTTPAATVEPTTPAETVETVEPTTPATPAETVEPTTPDAFGFTGSDVSVATVETLVADAVTGETTRVDAGIVAMIGVRRAVNCKALTFEGEGTLAKKVSKRWPGLGKESAVGSLLAVADLMLGLPGATPAAARASHSALGWGLGIKAQRAVADVLTDDEKADADTVLRTFEAARTAAQEKKEGTAPAKRAAAGKKEQEPVTLLVALETVGQHLAGLPDGHGFTPAEAAALETIMLQIMRLQETGTVLALPAEEAAA